MRYVIGIEWCIDAIKDTADGFINGYLSHIVEDILDQTNIWNVDYFEEWLNRKVRVCVVDAIIHLVFFDNYALSGDHFTKAYEGMIDEIIYLLAHDRAVDHGIFISNDPYACLSDEETDIVEDRLMDYATIIANVIIQYMSDMRIMDMSYMEEIIYEINSLISATTAGVILLEDRLSIHHPGRFVTVESKRGRLHGKISR